MISGSQLLRNNIINDFKCVNTVPLDVINFCCQNLYCRGHDFYRNGNKINEDSSLSVEQVLDIMANYSEHLQYVGTEAAHIIPQSKIKDKWIHKVNDSYNGILLCPNCHKYFDIGNGDWVPSSDLYDLHHQHMMDILKSKKIWNNYLCQH